jgi:hypothetical protein
LTTRVSVFVMAAAAAACLAVAQMADAAVYRFEGDRGTVCTVEVGAKASDSLGALSGPPQVGYSSVQTCSYASKPGAANSTKRKRACRKAKKKQGAKGAAKKRRGCKRAKRPDGSPRGGAPATAGRGVSVPALLDQARLELLGPLGNVTSVGEQTMAAPVIGYACSLALGAVCSDSGRLLPAVPGATYAPQFSLRLTPPPGEAWVKRPAASCSAGAVVQCVLGAAPVTPQI